MFFADVRRVGYRRSVAQALPVSVMVLAAGHGTRLRPLTDELPKPLVPVGDRSVLAHVVARLRAAGVARLVINAHHHAEAVARAAEDLELDATVVREAELLGTAGGVRNAAGALGEGEALVHNGDTLVELDPAELVGVHRALEPLATLAVTRARLPAGAGTVGLDAAGDVVRLRGERFGDEARGAEFAGVQILSAEARALLPREGCLVGDVYLPALRRGGRLAGATVVDRFDDIGTPRAYLAANLRWLGGPASFVADDVRLGRAVRLAETVLGRGAVVEGAGVLERCVVWPEAHARAPLREAIVLTSGRVVEL
jgi:mannose-1-phosphate guanylyltransferase